MRTAPRVDSVPLLVNLHCGKPKRFDSSSATIATSATGCAKWEPRAMRLETASTISGWAWPTTMTPNPLWKSTYSLPSTSHTRLPRPYSTKIGWGEASWKDDGDREGRPCLPAFDWRYQSGRRHSRRRVHWPVDRVPPDPDQTGPESGRVGARHLRRRAKRAQRWLRQRLVG